MEEPGIGLLFSDLIGLDLSGLGNADLEMLGGEGGGDGVDVVDKKVGREQSSGDSINSF